MTPSDETVAAYLALPIEARRMLAETAEGPGWWLWDAERLWACCGPANRPLLPGKWLTAWIPASPAETLRVWAAHVYQHDARELPWVTWEITQDECMVCLEDHDVEWKASHDGTLDGILRAAALCCPVGQ